MPLLAACAPAAEVPAATPTLVEAAPAPELTHIDLGVGFVPNVQFAPFYVAQAKGFFAEEGLEVALEYGYENDFVALTAQGERQFAVASGEQVILARAQGLPVVYVMKWYDHFPVAVMALAETGIQAPEDLAGRSVGVPVLSGASYVGWQALVYATGLDEDSVKLDVVGFAQAEAVTQKRVDAAVVYIANEPVQLRQAGMQVNVMPISDYIDLVSNGIITHETLMRDDPDLVRRMVRASLRGLEYARAHPDEAFAVARQAVPEITDETAPAQRAVLDASVELWGDEALGLSDPQAWSESVEFMRATGLIDSPVEVDAMYTNQFVEE
jgi:NitT/TauT family transport system substrate-binding protein